MMMGAALLRVSTETKGMSGSASMAAWMAFARLPESMGPAVAGAMSWGSDTTVPMLVVMFTERFVFFLGRGNRASSSDLMPVRRVKA